MGTGYTRQSLTEIQDGQDILATPLNAEFNAVQAAFNSSTGHTHDGTSGEGPLINLTTSITGVLPVGNGGISAKHKINGTAAPHEFNDATQGYGPGSIWIDTTNNKAYICVDDATSNAVWQEVGNDVISLLTEFVKRFSVEPYYVETPINTILSTVSTAIPSYVVTYIPMMGPDDYTDFLDLSANAFTVSGAGSVHVDHAQKVYGQPLTYFDGVGDTLSMDDDDEFAFSGDFTIDMFARFEDLAATRFLCGHLSNSTNYYAFFVNTDGSIEFKQVEGGSTTIQIVSSAGEIVANTTYHIALVRKTNDYAIYVDRFEVATGTDTTAIGNFTGEFRVGSFSTVGNMKGWIGRFRIMDCAFWHDGQPSTHSFALWPEQEWRHFPLEAYYKSGSKYYALVNHNVSPRTMGATGSGDEVTYILAMRDYAECNNADILIDGHYTTSETLRFDKPVTIKGIGRDKSSLTFDINREKEGLHVMTENLHMQDFSIYVDIPATIQNGQGTYGTCVTWGEIYYHPVYENTVIRNHPEVKNCTAYRMNFERVTGSFSGHALACTGRTSNIHIMDAIIYAPSASSRHADGLLTHWGLIGYDFPLDGSRATITPLVTQKVANTYTFHPRDIRLENIHATNVSRLIQNSASLGISLDGFIFDGLDDDTNSNGGQLWDVVMGDESDYYAHPEVKNILYSNLTIKNGVARNVSGSGAGSPSAVDMSGNSTSKTVTDPYTSSAQQFQPFVPNVILENVTIEGIPTDILELIDIRNFWGNVTLNNVYAYGYGMQSGTVAVEQCNGQVTFNNCTFKGGRVLVNDCEHVSFNNCYIESTQYPVVSITLTTSTADDFTIGDIITGGTSSVVGTVFAVPAAASTTLVVQQVSTSTKTYTVGETISNGTDTATVSSVAAYTFSTLEVTGSSGNTATADAATKGDTEITLSSAFTRDLKVGDMITWSGGSTLIRVYADVGSTLIQVESIPVNISGGTTLTVVRNRSQTVLNNTTVKGGRRGITVDNAMLVMNSGKVTGAGHYGVFADDNSYVVLNDVRFTRNGLERVWASSLPSTRDVLSDASGALFLNRCIFEQSTFILYNLVINASNVAGSARDCLFLGTPITGYTSIGGSVFVKDNCLDAAGSAV